MPAKNVNRTEFLSLSLSLSLSFFSSARSSLPQI